MNRAQDPDLSAAQMQLLWVGNNEKEFAYLRDVLTRSGEGRLGLDRVRSPEEALQRLNQTTYDLLLCDYKPGDGMALRLLHEIRKEGPRAPVIFLSDHVDQIAIDAAIKAGASDCLQTSNLNESSIARAIRYAIDVYCKERQRQKAEDTVRKLWRAVEQSADLVIITDRGGVIEYVNPAFEALTGYSREESVGRTPRILKSDQQTANLYQELWETILAGNVFRGVLVNRKKNGQIFYAEKTITPLRDTDGAITHFISNDRDITERRRLESQLQQAQKMDAIGRLAGGVAHDFNNLLMVISAYAELMLDSLGSEHPLRRNVQEIMTASRRAADLTRQLLAFGRKQMQSLQLLDLNRVIREINEMLPRLIGEDIQLIFAPGKNVGKVKAEGKGTGLGLATVYGIVKQNGGFIWVYSEPGLGTTFKIYLPCAQYEPEQKRPLKLVEEMLPGTETLLLVEDESAVRQSEREFLTLNGYSVLDARDGRDAISIAREYDGTIDMMNTDGIMPHMSGAKLAEQLLLERPGMKVLFVSGYAETTVLRHGAIDVTTRFLQKPFSLKMLAKKIREVLDAPLPAALASLSTP